MPNMTSVTQNRVNPAVPNLAYQWLRAQEETEQAEPQLTTAIVMIEWESGTPVSAEPCVSDGAIFRNLMEKWRQERGASSSITEIVLSPSYQSIIAMGEKAVPLILAELEAEGNEPDHWFWALQVLTGLNPVSEAIEGNLLAMSDAWRKMARAKGYVW